FFSSRRRHTRFSRDWSSDVCSSDLQERRALLGQLCRKYGETVDDVLAWAENAAKRLAELDGDDDRGEALRAEQAELAETMEGLAAELTGLRTDAAERFGAAVTAELTELAMPHARVEVRVTSGEEFGPNGRDDIELLMAPHSASPAL